MGITKLMAIDEVVFTEQGLKELTSNPVFVHDVEQLRNLTFARTTGWVRPPMVGGIMTVKRNDEEIKRWNERIEATRRAKKIRKGKKI